MNLLFPSTQNLCAAKKDLYSPAVASQDFQQQNYPSYYTQSGDYQLDNRVETLSFQSSPNHGQTPNGGGYLNCSSLGRLRIVATVVGGKKRRLSSIFDSCRRNGVSNFRLGQFENDRFFPPNSLAIPDVDMTCRDRTSEFFRIVEEERLKKQGAGLAQGRPKPMAKRSEFMNIAKAIGEKL